MNRATKRVKRERSVKRNDLPFVGNPNSSSFWRLLISFTSIIFCSFFLIFREPTNELTRLMIEARSAIIAVICSVLAMINLYDLVCAGVDKIVKKVHNIKLKRR
jgi:hypothetical protein